MEKIIYKNTLVAILVKKYKDGTSPVTEDLDPLQLITHKHSKDTYIKAHVHVPKKRVTQILQECLIVTKGKIKIGLYGPDKKFFKNKYLHVGEALILLNGGWSVSMSEDSEFIELKNGPFVQDKALIE